MPKEYLGKQGRKWRARASKAEQINTLYDSISTVIDMAHVFDFLEKEGVSTDVITKAKEKFPSQVISFRELVLLKLQELYATKPQEGSNEP